MSTHSMIAIKTDMGYDCIYVHSDGYLDSVGKALQASFNSDELALELVALGNCSAIAGRESTDDITAYHRDRNEAWHDVKPMCFATLSEAIDHFSCPYNYVWEVGNWSSWSAFDGRGDKYDW